MSHRNSNWKLGPDRSHAKPAVCTEKVFYRPLTPRQILRDDELKRAGTKTEKPSTAKVMSWKEAERRRKCGL